LKISEISLVGNGYLQALTHGGKAHALQATQEHRQARGHTIIRT
jgi:hypothetical protein